MRGFVAVSVVLILVSVVLAISVTVALLSIGEAQSGLVLYQGEDNLNYAEGCVEDVMLKIRSDPTYSGTGFTHPDSSGNTATCSITYNPGGGGPTNWDITLNSQTSSLQRKIRVIFTRNPTGIILTSWKEI